MPDGDDLIEMYKKADLRLRSLLLGDGLYEAGIVKGDEARTQVVRELARLRAAFDALREREKRQVAAEKARAADLEEELRSVAQELRRIAASRPSEQAAPERRKAG